MVCPRLAAYCFFQINIQISQYFVFATHGNTGLSFRKDKGLHSQISDFTSHYFQFIRDEIAGIDAVLYRQGLLPEESNSVNCSQWTLLAAYYLSPEQEAKPITAGLLQPEDFVQCFLLPALELVSWNALTMGYDLLLIWQTRQNHADKKGT